MSAPAWRAVNLVATQRAARILLGLATAAAGIVLLSRAGSAVAVVFESLATTIGVDLVVTGAIGHCPLYAELRRIRAAWATRPSAR